MTSTMTFDGITAAILAPMLKREGRTLSDLAASLAGQAYGGYAEHETNKGKHYLWWDFATAGGMTDQTAVELHAPGCDDFSSPSDRRPLARLPAMAGGIRRIGDRHQLAIGAIRLGDMQSNARLVMMTPHRPVLAIIGVDVPLTIQQATRDRPLRDVVSAPELDHAHIRIVRWRPVDAEKLRELDKGSDVDALGAKLKTLPAVTVAFNL